MEKSKIRPTDILFLPGDEITLLPTSARGKIAAVHITTARDEVYYVFQESDYTYYSLDNSTICLEYPGRSEVEFNRPGLFRKAVWELAFKNPWKPLKRYGIWPGDLYRVIPKVAHSRVDFASSPDMLMEVLRGPEDFIWPDMVDDDSRYTLVEKGPARLMLWPVPGSIITTECPVSDGCVYLGDCENCPWKSIKEGEDVKETE
jgi:hypothetical protein